MCEIEILYLVITSKTFALSIRQLDTAIFFGKYSKLYFCEDRNMREHIMQGLAVYKQSDVTWCVL